jgi:pyruvate dehydrogenase E2 component (dihydrolipoamide acetyltransferase)
MPTPIVVPKSTISMSHGTILHWVKKVGEFVAKEETLLELETDKAIVELPAPVEGTLLRIARDSGEVAVDQIIGWIGNPEDQIRDEVVVPAQVESSLPGIPQTAGVTSSLPPPVATPAARRRAKELGVDLQIIRGSGPGGRISEGDVEHCAHRRVEPVDSHRRALAEHVSEAWRNVPHIHIVRLMNVERLVKVKELISTDADPITYTDLVLSTVAKTLAQFTQLLFQAADGNTAGISVAFAVETENGVVTPTIQGVNTRPLAELARVRRDLTSLARFRKLQPEHLQPANFTLTNLGMFEVDLFAPIINTPQVAILATGQIKQQPVVENDEVLAGWRMWATLAADHRHIDGALAARFLSAWQVEMNRLSESQ